MKTKINNYTCFMSTVTMYIYLPWPCDVFKTGKDKMYKNDKLIWPERKKKNHTLTSLTRKINLPTLNRKRLWFQYDCSDTETKKKDNFLINCYFGTTFTYPDPPPLDPTPPLPSNTAVEYVNDRRWFKKMYGYT